MAEAQRSVAHYPYDERKTAEYMSSAGYTKGTNGFFTNAGIVGLYTLLALAYPTHLRATGTGVVIGAGRGGAALEPILAGYLFQQGLSLQTVSIVMGCGSLLGAAALLFVKYANTSEAAPAAATPASRP